MTIFSKFMASFDKREEKNYEILDFFLKIHLLEDRPWLLANLNMGYCSAVSRDRQVMHRRTSPKLSYSVTETDRTSLGGGRLVLLYHGYPSEAVNFYYMSL
jgi:hypothetical protein